VINWGEMVLFEHRASVILYNFLKAIDNDKVFLIPANVCPVVVATFCKAGKKYEFVDISLTNFCMDEALVLRAIRDYPDKYAGIVFVRTYGTTRPFESFFERIKDIDNKILIIDDRCLSMPEFEQRDITIADLVLYSTGYSKFVDIGWGGFAFLNNNSIDYKKNHLPYNEEHLKQLMNSIRGCIEKNMKFKFKDSDWLGDTDFDRDFEEYKTIVKTKLRETKDIKESLNKVYTKNLPREIQLEPDYQQWRFNVLLSDKKGLLEKIFENGLFASSHYASLSNIFQDTVCVNAQKFHNRVVNLFNDFRFSIEKAQKISDIINDHIRN